MTRKKVRYSTVLVVFAMATVAGLVFAVPMTYIAARENPQGEFDDVLDAVIMIGAPWFLFVALSVLIVCYVIWRLDRPKR